MSERKKRKFGRYFIFGVLNTAINYGMYEVLALTIFSGDQQLKYATLVSGVVSVFVGYFLHSKFTWKEQGFKTDQAVKFVACNGVMALGIKPLLTLGLEGKWLDPLYDFAHNILQMIPIGLAKSIMTYDFVKSTGVYVLMTAVVMILNFLVYDRFVFGKKTAKKNHKESRKNEDMEGVREAGEEV